jgi:RNA polymerase sigma-70 factor, ECF subfamily
MVEQLYQRHAGQVLRYLARRCPDPATASDLLQETFLQVVRQSNQLDRIKMPRAWLFGIARNLVAKYYRNQPDPTALRELAVAPEEPLEDERLDVLRDSIRKLPSELRETLELRLEQELSYEEIARVLDIPIGTVRSRLHNAVRYLRQEMTRQENL